MKKPRICATITRNDIQAAREVENLVDLFEVRIDIIGDDWTDEYTFDALPEGAFTIKVGTKTTKADYYVEDVADVRLILKELAGYIWTFTRPSVLLVTSSAHQC